MIHSTKLDVFFREYDPQYVQDMCRTIFGITYCKTYSDCGLYIWYGRDHTDFIYNFSIDKNSPMCWLNTKYVDRITGEEMSGLSVLIFLDHNEDEVIRMFSKCEKLKAFL
jgi:hypothetical protein